MADQQIRQLRGGWIEARGEGRYLLTRQWPAQFDIAASARFDDLRPARLARQIRQDMWRALQGLRGFAPAVQICFTGAGLDVTAGGRVNGRIPHGIESQIQTLLDDPARRARWSAWARRDA
ncbi:hypothetical protein [Sagittula sp. SSi028]|uniref:hypothetical protein n=1 Tax=Sagittula sp. SSi028 TaxID=3400636 RepID=UPI003AF4A5C3